ncbi:MAG: ArsR/SmtB family transcription factor [Gemmatimonadaceae bacterium]
MRAAAQAALLLHGARGRLIALLAEADTATGISRRTGLSRQRVGYHLRALERAGLIECVSERRKGNCIERVLRATARSYVIAPEALGALGGGGGGGGGGAFEDGGGGRSGSGRSEGSGGTEGTGGTGGTGGTEGSRSRFSTATLMLAAAGVMRDAAALDEATRRTGKRMATLTIETEVGLATADARAAFAEELSDLLARLVAKYQDERVPNAAERIYRLSLLARPTPLSDALAGPADSQADGA